MLILTAATFFVLGYELAARLWRRPDQPLDGLQRVVAAGSIGFAFWIGSLWSLALLGHLSAPALAARNIVAAVIAAVLWIGRWRRAGGDDEAPSPPAGITFVAVLPLFLWLAFVMWRGAVVPPLSHDALAYHLPKAALYARAESYDPLPQLPTRARNIPVNYELLLADVLLIEGRDDHTEWLSALHYLFFVLAATALARRWWVTSGAEDLVIALLVAAVPVALLHSGAHKNDLMTAGFMTAALVWLGRFTVTGELRSLLLLAATLAMAAGTKPQAALLAFAAMPFTLWRLGRSPRFAVRMGATAASSVVFALLLGAAYWPIDRGATPAGASTSASPVSYGDWENLYQVPYVLVAAPFSTSSTALNVPWAEHPWFWRRYEIFFSELGIPLAVCALLLPVAVLVFRRRTPERRAERTVVSIVTAITFVAMLPVVFRPLGFYAISTPRYALFIVPVIFAWTIAPFIRFVVPQAGRRAAVAAAAIIFLGYAVLVGLNDRFVPLPYVAWAAQHAGTRVIPFDPNRAASVVDRIAAPDAVVAIEAADGAWLYPAFGADLMRRVELVPAGSAQPGVPDADWFVIDRKFSAVWKHPQFRDLSQTGQFISRGAASLETDPLFRSLDRSGTWRAVHVDASSGEAVFQRQPQSARPRP